MKTKNFPLVDPSNLWLSCFNCSSDMYDFYYQKSDNEAGNGKYYASCECCGMRTYFDFKKGSDAENSN